MEGLRKFIDQLKQHPEEKLIEPELKADRKEKDRVIREEQDLRAGAVLEVTTAAGQGSDSPREGDLVYIHYNVRSVEDDLLYSTRAEEGGSGQPLAFSVGKGSWRAPRSWELAVLSMTRQQCKRLKVQPSYGYQHPDCHMSPPAAAQAHVGDVLQFDLQLVNWYPQDQVRSCGDDGNMFKRVLVESDKWETARPPNEVCFSVEGRTPAYDGTQLSGYKYYSSSPDEPLRLQLGQGLIPQGLETALSYMSKGEQAVFVIPAQQMVFSTSSGSKASSDRGSSRQQQQQDSGDHGQQQDDRVMIPPPPSKAVQVELCVTLHDLVQVRDMTGDGQVTKKRLREGQGEFPVDCPLHDTRLRCHYRVRQASSSAAAASASGPWLLDTLQSAVDGSKEAAVNVSDSNISNTNGSSSSKDDSLSWADAVSAASGSGCAVEVDTGCGELPDGLEMCLKLMVPGELASVVCQSKYAYQDRSDVPPGIDLSQPVEFQCVLLSFDREGYWQHMEWGERWALAEKIKDKGRQLYQQKKYAYASNRYTHLLRLLESTRDYETQEQVDKADSYKATLLSNLALVTFQQEEYARCVEWCDKALQADPTNAKVIFRKGKALSMKGDYEEAEEYLGAAAEVDTSLEGEVKAAITANKQRAKAAAAKQKQQFSDFFSKA